MYKFGSNLVCYLPSAYSNMVTFIYSETNHRNRLIYILIHVEVKNNKMLFFFNSGIGLLHCFFLGLPQQG